MDALFVNNLFQTSKPIYMNTVDFVHQIQQEIVFLVNIFISALKVFHFDFFTT